MAFEISHCQGKTQTGLSFGEFCGGEWDEVIEKRFKEWAVTVFGSTFPPGVM